MKAKLTKSIAVCPKCKSKDLILIETLTAGTSVKQTNGYIDSSTSNNEYGNIFKVEGECCKCGHTWRFRNKIQITSLLVDDDDYLA